MSAAVLRMTADLGVDVFPGICSCVTSRDFKFNMARPAVLSKTQQNRSSDGDDEFLGVAADPVGANMSLSF